VENLGDALPDRLAGFVQLLGKPGSPLLWADAVSKALCARVADRPAIVTDLLPNRWGRIAEAALAFEIRSPSL
jgi:hypothetical protein